MKNKDEVINRISLVRDRLSNCRDNYEMPEEVAATLSSEIDELIDVTKQILCTNHRSGTKNRIYGKTRF